MESKDRKLIDQLEEDAHNEDLWYPDPGDESSSRGLGATITVRLDAGTARDLRRVASSQGVGYSTLLRMWVKDRLADEALGGPLVPVAPVVELAGWSDPARRAFSASVLVTRSA